MFGGAIVLPGAIALIILALRYLPAAEVALLSLLEVVLGPLLVWIVLSEMPTLRTISGGLIVLVTLSLYKGVV